VQGAKLFVARLHTFTQATMCVYLLHFTTPYTGTQRNPAAQRTQIVRHYIGYTEDLEARIEAHRAGNGARLVKVLADAGIGFVVSRSWPQESRAFERQLKNRKNSRKLCPLCNPALKEAPPVVTLADLEPIAY
jgi:predicted GIY-YIG superfamily endonuclease